MRSADTSPEAHDRQMSAYRSMSPDQRLAIAVEMSEAVMALAESGIRDRHPDYDDDEVAWALLRLRLGDRVFREVWPAGPLLAA